VERLHQLIRELRRRHVFRVAGIYIVAAWIVVQVADTAFPGMNVPEAAIRYVWFAAFLGFPLALVFGWRYDITARGIVRTPRVEADIQVDLSLRRTDHVILALLLVVAIGVIYQLIVQISTSRSLEPAAIVQQDVEPNSIAVLPLDNLSGDPEQQYFVSGMQDALISNLSRVKALRVTSKTSTLRYQDSGESLPRIGAQLGVAKLIEGSIYRAGTRVRINVQLIDAANDEHIWSESFENEIEDVLSLQKNVARAIAEAVAAAVSPDERQSLTIGAKIDPQAYEAVLKGVFHLQRFTPQDMALAAQYFQLAMQLDPDSALAHIGLAGLCGFQAQAGLITPQEGRDRCWPPIQKALELDDSLPEAHLNYAAHMAWLRFDWVEAESGFRRALELNPSLTDARMFYSHFLTLTGDFEGGWEQMRLALDLDPFNPFVQALHGAQLIQSDRYEEAVEVTERVLASNPGFGFGHHVLWMAYHKLGEQNKSIAAAAQTFRIHGYPYTDVADLLEESYADGDYVGALMQAAAALEELSETSRVAPFPLSRLYEFAGEVEKAIDWCEVAVRDGDPGAPYIAVETKLEAIRQHPRFIALLREMELDYWADKFSQLQEGITRPVAIFLITEKFKPPLP
jgi:TolB-like protein